MRILAVLFFLIFSASPAYATTFEGVTWLRCYDGDTCTFDVPMEDAFFGRFTMHDRAVRLAGTDTPELKGFPVRV